jgi:hypothetical protein
VTLQEFSVHSSKIKTETRSLLLCRYAIDGVQALVTHWEVSSCDEDDEDYEEDFLCSIPTTDGERYLRFAPLPLTGDVFCP